MHPIEGPLVMIPVERIEALMQEPADQSLARGESTMQNVTVKKVFDKSPGRAAREEEEDCDPRMLCRKRDRQHENRVQGVEGRQDRKSTRLNSSQTVRSYAV